MARRETLMHRLIEYLVDESSGAREAGDRLAPLVREYGSHEVQRMLERLARRLGGAGNRRQSTRTLYREYLDLYRRFGGDRPLLDRAQFARLNDERAGLIARKLMGGRMLSGAERRRLDELTGLLLADSDLWDDLVPESPPRSVPPAP